MTGRALKNAETIDGALAPTLTAWDLKILRAVPEHRPILELVAARAAGTPGGLTAWGVAETAREYDVQTVLGVLRGLSRRHLVYPLGEDTQRVLRRWIRTEEGDRRV